MQPIIPHYIIANAFANLSIKIQSLITLIKAGFTNDKYGYIKSFRRQIYIHYNDHDKVPSSILIQFDQTEYRIILSDNTVMCYFCKQTSYTSNHCKIETESKITNIQHHNFNLTSVNSDTENNSQ